MTGRKFWKLLASTALVSFFAFSAVVFLSAYAKYGHGEFVPIGGLIRKMNYYVHLFDMRYMAASMIAFVVMTTALTVYDSMR